VFEPFALKAPAKVNLALHVLGRRADGYHDLDSIVAFADVGDELAFRPSDQFSLTASGPFAAALPAAADNMIGKACRGAAEIAARRGRPIPAAAVHLTKNLPVASGIGGGSANAAAAMHGFLKLAGIEGLDDEIMAAALTLGADVPVCLLGKACRMQGVGERILPLEDFKPLHAMLVNPGVAVSTAEVFRQLGLAPGQSYAAPIADVTDPSSWRNDLAAPAIALSPVIGDVISTLGRHPGITRVFMSGSGATCVALYDIECGKLDPAWWSARTVLF
jgi:4-diphosphocytidyl-2-C-methyl-D-erythritol kinase